MEVRITERRIERGADKGGRDEVLLRLAVVDDDGRVIYEETYAAPLRGMTTEKLQARVDERRQALLDRAESLPRVDLEAIR